MTKLCLIFLVYFYEASITCFLNRIPLCSLKRGSLRWQDKKFKEWYKFKKIAQRYWSQFLNHSLHKICWHQQLHKCISWENNALLLLKRNDNRWSSHIYRYTNMCELQIKNALLCYLLLKEFKAFYLYGYG